MWAVEVSPFSKKIKLDGSLFVVLEDEKIYV